MWLRCEIANRYYGNRKGNKSLLLLEWRKRWRRRNEAQTFSRILSTARCFSHTLAFSLSLIPYCWLCFLSSDCLYRFFHQPCALCLTLFYCLSVCLSVSHVRWRCEKQLGSLGKKGYERVRKGQECESKEM